MLGSPFISLFLVLYLAVQSLICVQLFASPCTVARQVFLSFTVSLSLLRLVFLSHWVGHAIQPSYPLPTHHFLAVLFHPHARLVVLTSPSLLFSSATSYSERCPPLFLLLISNSPFTFSLAWLLFPLWQYFFFFLQNQIPPNKELGAFLKGPPDKSPRKTWKGSRSVVSDSSWPHGLQPTRLLHPWDFPGKSTGVGCHCLLRKTQTTLQFLYLRINLIFDL